MRQMLRSIVLLSLLFFVTTRVNAVDFKSADSVIVKKSDTIAQSIVMSGSTVTVEGYIQGDVYCAGKTVVITGVVDGDILCVGQDIRIDGEVKGNVRVVGQSIVITGAVGKNVNVVSQYFSTNPSSQIRGEVLYGAQTVSISGFAKSVSGGSQDTSISGNIAGDAQIYGDKLSITDNARIAGKLSYTSQKAATIAKTASISGQISHWQPEKVAQSEPKKDRQMNSTDPAAWPANALGAVFLNTLLGLVIVAIWSKKIIEVQQIIHKKGFIASIVGFIALIGAPIVVILLVVTLIGIVVVPFVIVAYFFAAGFGRIVAGILLGKSIIEGFNEKQKDNLYLQTIIGVPILWFMCKAPFVGGIFTFISIIIGLGAVLLSFQKKQS